MTATRITALAIALLTLVPNVRGESVSAEEVLDKVAVAYKALDTFKAEGTVTSDIKTDGQTTKIEVAFSILLKKPNLYFVSWTQKIGAVSGLVQSGAVWSDGTQPYLYMGTASGTFSHHSYSKEPSDMFALAAAAGVSLGAAYNVPSLFLPEFPVSVPLLARLAYPSIEKTEKVEGEECYVVSESSGEQTYWISKSTYLIRKYRRSSAHSEEESAASELTDEQVKQVIESTGLEATPKRVSDAKETMGKARLAAKTKTKTSQSTSTTIYANISTPKLSKRDFNFPVPKKAVLKESMFSGMAGQGMGDCETNDE